MSLVTRCPNCRTLFRVTPAQLQARAGEVRCGRCMQVFDALPSLAAEQAASGVAAPSRAGNVPRENEPSNESAQPQAAGETRDSGVAPAQSAPKPASAGDDGATSEAKTERAAGGQTVLERRHRAAAWAVGSAFLVLTLGVQAAYAWRSEIAARYPSARLVLESLCRAAGCVVGLPQRPDLVRIEASDVHTIDSNRPSLIQLTATLRSYASYDLGYPALDLVLTNANEHALARRIFLPHEYLGRSRDLKAGIPPNAEITVALDLDTGDLNPAGFRLDLLAAPTKNGAAK